MSAIDYLKNKASTIKNYGPGNWELGNYRLPELGITELFSKNTDSLNDAARRTMESTLGKEATSQYLKDGGYIGGGDYRLDTSKSGGSSGSKDSGKQDSGGGFDASDALGKLGYENKDQFKKETGFSSVEEYIKQMGASAEAEAERKRVAARNAYQVVQKAGEQAKGRAKGTYDWIIDTLGTNKEDLLTKLTLQEEEGMTQYGMQEEKTGRAYADARGEILNTYRDLKKEQEKLLRGSGQAQSSRSLEAAMKLNNLMGKDLNSLSTNEADSIALIGNAVDSFQKKILASKESVEKEANLRADNAALQYQQQIDQIDLNLFLSEKEKEDAYKAAESQLASDIADIDQWAIQMEAATKEATKTDADILDSLVLSLTDERGLLGADLQTKYNAVQQSMGLPQATLTPETGVENITQGTLQKVSQRFNSKEELDRALLTGQITPAEYNTQMKLVESGTGALAVNLPTAEQLQSNPAAVSASSRITSDPLVRALMA